MRLDLLSASANIPADQRNREILVIRLQTFDMDTRNKCIEADVTLDILLTWRKGHDLKIACAAQMEQKHSQYNINAISGGKNSTPGS